MIIPKIGHFSIEQSIFKEADMKASGIILWRAFTRKKCQNVKTKPGDLLLNMLWNCYFASIFRRMHSFFIFVEIHFGPAFDGSFTFENGDFLSNEFYRANKYLSRVEFLRPLPTPQAAMSPLKRNES